jgi:hypothetical protein
MSLQSAFSNLMTSRIQTRKAQIGKAETNWKANMCFSNAYHNREAVSEALGREFKIVLGGIGFNGWFEYGHANPNSPSYEKKTADSHAWLESDDGFIIDYMFPEYQDFMNIRGIPITFPVGQVVMGTRKTLKKKYGLDYAPANKDIQALIFKNQVGFYY